MDAHRKISPDDVQYINLSQPYSCFDLIADQFGGNTAIRRCFSLARSFNAVSVLIEDISPAGIVDDENSEILQLHPDYCFAGLKRVSFWRKRIATAKGIPHCNDNDLIGYALLKRDIVPGLAMDAWHVFEAVIRKYEHAHNCVPSPGKYHVGILDKAFGIRGVLYCQQNALNKACAHVALRSLLSRLVPQGDVSYRELNEIATKVARKKHNPADGLNVKMMQAILRAHGIGYADLDYDAVAQTDPDIRKDVPYQKYLYAGIESGCGGLLGFSMAGPKAVDGRHIIPFYGHTFNKDTWAPDANKSYFNIGSNVGYIPSEMWTSSFIGHDDNFGPNFCIPRLYVNPEQAQYVVELKKGDAQYGGIIAEAQALQFMYSLHPKLTGKNRWTQRLKHYSHPSVQEVVLRAICVERDDYLKHLSEMQCWEGESEASHLAPALSGLLPELLWVVEISIPHLFPANERKLGEIVLNASQVRDCSKSVDYNLFMLARFPAQYFLLEQTKKSGPEFLTFPSRLISHTPVIRTVH